MEEIESIPILAVDDQPRNLVSLEAIFESENLELVCVTSGKEALRQLLDREFAVILMDASMPVMDGFETARAIHSRKKTRHVPIIFLTATHRDNVHAELGYESGAVDFIFKPVIPEILRAKVSVFVELFKKNEQIKRHSEENERLATELQNRLSELSRKNQELKRLASIVESSHDAIFSTDIGGRITSWNRAAADLFGYSEGEIIGELVSVLFPVGHSDRESEILRGLKEESETGNFETLRCSRDGALIDLSITVSNITDIEGKIIGHSRIARDISRQKLYQDMLEESQEELELLNRSLLEAKNQAVQASKLKSEFVANMSHEIRTPMNGILGMCNILQDTPLTHKQKEYVKAIHEAGGTLLTVINDILDFSKIEAGKLQIENVEFEPVGLVEGICQLLSTQAKSRKLSLVSFVDPDLPGVLRGDSERLKQILSNLLNNAIKFSEKGEIVIRASIASSSNSSLDVIFSVEDSGIGLTEEEQAKLFQPFVQADGSISRQYGGTGLGLSICKKLVELMGGSIGMHSEKGVGSKFWVRLPLEPCSRTPLISPREELENLKVLVVDDQPNSREILSSYIKSWGMRPMLASSGREALETLQAAVTSGDTFDVAIIDLVMPGMDGLTLSKKIREDESLEDTRLILLTAFDSSAFDKNEIALGFDAYLTKPVRQSHLLNCICDVMEVGRKLSGDGDIENSASGLDVYSVIGSPVRVLVVDDYPINQQVVKIYLEKWGYSVSIASNGKDAITILEAEDFDLILMDCQMPVMDGFTATGLIRKKENQTGVRHPIIAMTAYAMDSDRERCLSAGMDDYVSKPIDPVLLRNSLEKWLPDSITRQTDFNEQILAGDSIPQALFNVDLLKSDFGLSGARELVAAFKKEAETFMPKLRAAEESRDAVALADVAHGITGCCGVVKSSELIGLAQKMQTVGESCDWTQGSIYLDEFEEVLEQTLLQISSFLNCPDDDS